MAFFQNIVIQSKDDNEDFRSFLHCIDSADNKWEIRGYGKTAGQAADDAWKNFKKGEGNWDDDGYVVD